MVKKYDTDTNRMELPWRKYHGKDGTHTCHILLAVGTPIALFFLTLSFIAPSHGIILQAMAVTILCAIALLAIKHSEISVETTPDGVILTYLFKKIYVPWVAYKKMILLIPIYSSRQDMMALSEQEYDSNKNWEEAYTALIVLRNGIKYEIPVLDSEVFTGIEKGYLSTTLR